MKITVHSGPGGVSGWDIEIDFKDIASGYDINKLPGVDQVLRELTWSGPTPDVTPIAGASEPPKSTERLVERGEPPGNPIPDDGIPDRYKPVYGVIASSRSGLTAHQVQDIMAHSGLSKRTIWRHITQLMTYGHIAIEVDRYVATRVNV